MTRASHRADADASGNRLTYLRREDGRIFHTYSAYARGIDVVNTAYNYLDLVPKGRDEDPHGPRARRWVRRRDEYDR